MGYYRVRGLPGFDNLIVEGNQIVVYNGSNARVDVLDVKNIINAEVIIGDRQLKFPIPPGSLFMSADVLKEIDDPSLREWTTQSPFGKLEFEGHWKNEQIQVDYAKYSNGMSVNVKDVSLDPPKSIYTQNYFEKFADLAEQAIQDALRENNFIEDLVFVLKDISSDQKIHNNIVEE